MRQQNGIWLPDLSPKQLDVFGDYHRFLLLTGPRKCGKTLGACHKILRHCFDIQCADGGGARVAVFTVTTKNAKAGGVWMDLTQIALPQWVAANIGMRVVEEPAVTGDTRMSYFKVSNRYGGTAEIQLHSLDYCPDIVEKIRGGRFSLVYFCELDNFDDRIVFDISEDQLRMVGLPWEQHQWIGDTNPPESGTNNWMHDFWFKEKEQEDHPDKAFQGQIHRIEFTLDDNPYLDEREKSTLIAKYRRRQSLYNRFVKGIWEEDLTNGFFSDVFLENAHVLGNILKPDRKDWDVITPSSSCTGLIAGFDIGEVNHSAHIVEKIEAPDGNHVYAVLDELVSLDKNVSVREFTVAFLRMMDKWERYCMEKYNRKIQWRCWSDNSAMRWRSAAEATDALIVRNVSGGRIMLQAAPKFNHSVMARVDCLHRMLYEKRMFYSASCPYTIKMTKALKRGSTKIEPIDRRGGHIHVFDSLTYILLAEDPMDILVNGPRKAAPSVGAFTV